MAAVVQHKSQLLGRQAGAALDEKNKGLGNLRLSSGRTVAICELHFICRGHGLLHAVV